MCTKENLVFLAVLPFLGNTEVCSVTKVSCYDLKTNDGYRYAINSVEPPTEIQASQNGKNIGYKEPGLEPRFSKEVVKMDNHSITTHKCVDTELKAFFNTEGDKTSEICERFNIIEKETIPEAQNPSSAWKPIVAVVVVVFAVILFAALGYVLWKKKRKGEGTTFSVSLKELSTCSCFRKGISDEERGSEPISCNDLMHQNMHNQNMHNSQQEQQQGLLPTGDSSEAEADDKTPLRINMDHNLTTANGCAGSPGVIGAAVPQGMNGNVWHAAGDGTEEHSNGNVLNGGTLGEQGPEGLKSDGAVLPCSERAARRSVDETGETEALVNMLGSGSECTTPPRDIEKGITTKEEK